MAAIDQYIERIADENLRGEIQTELARLMKKKSFGFSNMTVFITGIT